ncbi:oligosaccharide flippase family protein [Desulfurococcaceae archaeon MEX13E-LK6-19]|nr:oligosaccharide flippase family protein [Desulfurococcaceae archaeon MEX13E-LK6-19]
MRAEEVSVGRIVRGGFWLYVSGVVNNLSGFLYWMVISVIAGPGVVGVVSAVVSFASLVAGLLNIGIDVGVQRFYGMAIGRNDKIRLSQYFWSAFFYTLLIYCLAFLCIFSLSLLGYGFSGLTPLMLMFSSIFILFNISICINALIISLLRTDIYFLATIVGNILKFIVGTGLVLFGWGWIGAVLGYMCSSFVGLIIGFVFSLKHIIRRFMFSLNALRSILIAGFASWLPKVIGLFGKWLGVLVVFSVAGAVETGYYYVAFAIASVVLMIATSMLRLLLPVLSGMSDGRKRAASRVLRVSAALMSPLAVFLMFYSYLPLALLGEEYVKASLILSVLLLPSLLMIVNSCINSLIYAYGYYRLVLILGLGANIPRIILYYILVPLYGGLGAAVSFVFGAFTGFITALVIARRISFYIGFRDLILIYSIPLVSTLLAYINNVPWYISGILILIVCSIGYSLFGIITRNDLKEVSQAFLSREKTIWLYYKFKPLIDILFKED